jgi:hypothetical protein
MWIFLGVSIFILACIVIGMHKNISKIEFYVTYFFMLILSWSINVVIDVKYNLRGFFQNGPDYPTMLIYIIIFPCIGLIFLNFYPYKLKKIKKVVYILISLLIVLVYDMLLIKFEILYYNNWGYLYSTLIYAIDFLFIILNLKIVKHLSQNSTSKNNK